MHSFIFQFSLTPVGEEKYLSEDKVLSRTVETFGEYSADYVSELKEEKRAEVIESLVSHWLPSDLFKGNPDGTFTYLGGFDKWLVNFFIPYVQEAAMSLNTEKATSIGLGSTYEVKKRIENPLNLSIYIFITDPQYGKDVVTKPVMKTGKFLEDFVKFLEPGQKIYIGGVYDYHF